MSLEARIAELNDTIKANTSLLQQLIQLQGGTGTVTEVKAEPVKKRTAEVAAAAKPSSDSATAPVVEAQPSTTEITASGASACEQTSATIVTADSPETPVELKADEVTLTEITAVVLALGKAGKRDALVKLLGEYEVPKASALDPSKFAEFHKKANALLGG